MQIWVPAMPFPDATGWNAYNLSTEINSLCEKNNEFYVGGSFTAIGGSVAHKIESRNGTS